MVVMVQHRTTWHLSRFHLILLVFYKKNQTAENRKQGRETSQRMVMYTFHTTRFDVLKDNKARAVNAIEKTRTKYKKV